MLWFLLACVTCPEGFERSGGQCTPLAPGTPIEPAPLDANTFLDRYERDACKALEDCLCDELGLPARDCDLDDCDTTELAEVQDCAFDRGAAEDCLAGRWECDVDGDVVIAIAPAPCSAVFDCTAPPSETGDTGAR
jgi:hypothetical protein